METAKEYIEKYNDRLKEFLTDNDVTEDVFIGKELFALDNIKIEIENLDDLKDKSLIGFEKRKRIIEFIKSKGIESFYYSIGKKIDFLNNKNLPPIKTSAIIEKHYDEILKPTTSRKYIFQKLALMYDIKPGAIKQAWNRYSKLDSR